MSGRKHIWKVLRKFYGVFFCMWVVWDPKLQVGTLTQVSSLAFWHGLVGCAVICFCPGKNGVLSGLWMKKLSQSVSIAE